MLQGMLRKFLWDVEEAIRSLDPTSPKGKRYLAHLESLGDRKPEPTAWNDELAEPLEHCIWTVYGCLTLLLIPTLALALFDMFVGLRINTAFALAALVLHLSYAALWKEHPDTPLVVLCTLVMLPLVPPISSAAAFSCWLWIMSLYVPLSEYLQDDISDREEVALFCVGVFFGGFSACVSAFMAAYDPSWWVLGRIGISWLSIVVFVFGTPMLLSFDWLRLRVLNLPHETAVLVVRSFLYQCNWVARRSIRPIRSLAASPGGERLARLVSRRSDMVLPTEPTQERTSRYKYAPIQPTQIRLLEVHSGHPSQPVRCSLRVFRLENAPPFEAISYVWGTGDFVRSIEVDGKPLMMTESAFSIIERRRSRWFWRRLWIDQVCIDQSNLDERASQVQLMGTLYARAWRVVAWLGPSGTADLVQSSIAQLRYAKEGMGLSPEWLMFVSLPMRRRWRALDEFFSNAFFTRAWIVQEVALSRELHLIYGSVCMDWSSIGEALEVLLDNHVLDNFLVEDGSGDSSPGGRDVFYGISNAESMREFRGDAWYRRRFSLYTILHNTVGFNSSDPRDKIYALSRIVEDTDIVPDYRIQAEALYTQTMRDILQQSGTFEALEFAGIGWPRLLPDLPSWVSDWSTGERILGWHHAAGTAYEPVIRFEADPSALVLEGWHLDRISRITGPLQPMSESSSTEQVRVQEAWLAEAEAMAMAFALHYPEDDRLECFARTLMNNHSTRSGSDDSPPTRDECLGLYRDLRQYLSIFETALDVIHPQRRKARVEALRARLFDQAEEDPFAAMLTGLQYRMEMARPTFTAAEQLDIRLRFGAGSVAALHFGHVSIMNRSRFCVTELDRMGIVPANCQVGDTLSVVKGARAPFALREVVAVDGRKAFKLVGGCYVHGMMEGELAELRERPAEPITLV